MHLLKRAFLTLSLLTSLSAPALLAQAAEAPAAALPKPPKSDNSGQNRRYADRLQMLADKLGLTEDQKSKIGPILIEEIAARKAVHDDKTLQDDARREKMKAVNESFNAKVVALLTPEQKVKFDALKSMGDMMPRKKKDKDKE